MCHYVPVVVFIFGHFVSSHGLVLHSVMQYSYSSA